MHSESLSRLKAPREHQSILAHPPLDQAGTLLAANAAALRSCTLTLQGRPLLVLRDLARREALGAARRYLEEAGEPVPDWGGDTLLVAGHQPELFHPGVWFKNFALQGLARMLGAAPLNLVVDNDTAKATILRVPHGMSVAKVPFDSWHSETPYEERTVQDEALFASLPKRLAPLIRDWPFKPLMNEFWSQALRQRSRTDLLGERFAAARRDLERAWGYRPLEVPLSRICQTEAFAWFAIHILRELPRFHSIYNGAVQAYRKRHDLRSRLHPVPNLAQDGAWLESPFWSWRQGEQRRHRLWARVELDGLHLRAGASVWPILPADTTAGVAQWQQVERQGQRVRTRALTTTLFSRLLLGDLFMHGIGGGKYDEVTDDILREFFGIEPPGYLVLTATLLLPLERFPAAAGEVRRLSQLRRDVHWNPQRHLDGIVRDSKDLIAEKQRWIAASVASHDERAARFRHLRNANERLRPYVRGDMERVDRALDETTGRLWLHEVRSSRDYAFCLYPEEMLREFYQRTTG